MLSTQRGFNKPPVVACLNNGGVFSCCACAIQNILLQLVNSLGQSFCCDGSNATAWQAAAGKETACPLVQAETLEADLAQAQAVLGGDWEGVSSAETDSSWGSPECSSRHLA